MIVLQFLMAVWLCVLSILLLVVLRQIGLLERRIPEKDPMHQGLDPNTPCPEVQCRAYQQEEAVSLPPENRPCVLLFASFSCEVCRSVLEGLRDLSDAAADSLILMVLDAHFELLFDRDLRRMGLQRFQLLDAYEHAPAFKIGTTPCAYALSPDGTVVERKVINHADQLIKMTSRISLP